MRIIEDIKSERDRIQACIDKYGRTPDHNLDWFLFCADKGEPRIFMWDEEYAVFVYENKKDGSLVLFSDPLAPEEQNERILKETIDFALLSHNKILILDVRDYSHDTIKNLYPDEYKFDYDIVWPVVNVVLFNSELPGSSFKSIRNALNKFRREHSVEVKTAESVDSKELNKIVERWHDNRLKAGIEELYPLRYHNMADANFRGTKSARVMFIDGKAVGFNAGWEMPNNSNQWSATIGLHDFSVKDLGLALLAEDLEWIKNAGYKTCDLGGTDPQALRFKTQFFPGGYNKYKTYSFFVEKLQNF